MRKGGRKIKRSKSIYGNKRKNKMKSFFTVIFMLIVIAGLIFLGYSVGEPIMDFFKNKADNKSSSEPWSPSDVTSNTSTSGNTSDSSDSSSGNQNGNLNSGEMLAYQLTVQDIQSESSLTSAVKDAKASGYTAVVAELKSEGGTVNYKSGVELVLKANDTAHSFNAAGIAKVIKDNGMIPVAKINTLNDKLTPLADKTTGYLFENSESAWYDNDPANGGKPWLNPFSDNTKKYFTDISAEICSAGFTEIICDDVIFPPFRTSDLNYIGETVKSADRYKALINIVNIFKNSAENTSAAVLIEASAKSVIEDTAEVFKPSELTGVNAVIEYNTSELGNKLISGSTEINLAELSVYDKVKTVYENVKAKSGELTIIPYINLEGMSGNDVTEAVKAIGDLGYKNYIIK